jgi:hypothetical protein
MYEMKLLCGMTAVIITVHAGMNLLKNGVFWDVSRVALIRTDVSEELSDSFIRVLRSVHRLLVLFIVHRFLSH